MPAMSSPRTSTSPACTPPAPRCPAWPPRRRLPAQSSATLGLMRSRRSRRLRCSPRGLEPCESRPDDGVVVVQQIAPAIVAGGGAAVEPTVGEQDGDEYLVVIRTTDARDDSSTSARSGLVSPTHAACLRRAARRSGTENVLGQVAAVADPDERGVGAVQDQRPSGDGGSCPARRPRSVPGWPCGHARRRGVVARGNPTCPECAVAATDGATILRMSKPCSTASGSIATVLNRVAPVGCAPMS